MPDSLRDQAATYMATRQHYFERVEAQLGFACSLLQLHPEETKDLAPLIERAEEQVAQALSSDEKKAEELVAEVEDMLSPFGDLAKSYTVYCVGHAHIDMNWMWSWPETVAVTNDTFMTVLRLMEEFPQFRFSQSQASVYRIAEEHNPRLLEKIAQRVKEGRWEVTASHWVEGDKNLAGGESLCRHLLYTRRYMQKLFGLSPEDVPIDWSPDTFGHALTVPTYLVRGGVKYLYLHRPGAFGTPRPTAFWWEGPDGSRVLVRNDMKLGYNGQITPAIANHLVDFAKESGLRFVMFVYGVGDHGGGPTRRDLIRALDMQSWPIFPEVRFATAKEFYDRLAAEGEKLPVLDCELNYEFTGCYTTQTLIKKANRYAEKRLLDAELAAALSATVLGSEYPTGKFEEGWRDTLFSHFHDILPGSGVRDTRTYTHGLYQKTVAMTSMEQTKHLRALAAAIDTSAAGEPKEPADPPSSLSNALGAGVGFGAQDGALSQSEQSAGSGNRPFVIFNPTAWRRNEIVEATVWENARGWRVRDLRSVPFAVRTPEGEFVPAQVVDTGKYWGHDYVRLAFPAEVGSAGWSLYTIVEERAEKNDALPEARQLGFSHHCSYSRYERSPEGLENDQVRLQIDPETGGIASLVHKPSGAKLISEERPAPVLEYAVERPHGMSAWIVDHTGPAERAEVVSITRRLDGPYKAALDVRLRFGESEFTLTYELRANDPNLYMHISGLWTKVGSREKGVPVLRASFPLSLTEAKTRYEIPYGTIDRDMPHGEEVPALRWAQVTGKTGGKQAGCLLLNDSKHGYSFKDGCLRLTLIRSSYEPDPLPEVDKHEIHLALRPFSGEMPPVEATRIGRSFNHELHVVGTDVHEGQLPVQAEPITVSPGSVLLGALKKAEDDDALILRLFDPTGDACQATLKLDTEVLGEVEEAQAVDLLERPVSGEVNWTKDSVSCRVPAFGIVSLKVKLKR